MKTVLKKMFEINHPEKVSHIQIFNTKGASFRFPFSGEVQTIYFEIEIPEQKVELTERQIDEAYGRFLTGPKQSFYQFKKELGFN